ncbi:MAG: DUF1353 domain-containing protein [Henriciella sp.]|uniref:DUF1353 domain-containing protein n=1 Tax=Henriciella sp. TaxID=1968823 RepID=UPI003C7330D0
MWGPRPVRPANSEVEAGLVLSFKDVRRTGTLRQGRPEWELLRPVWFEGFKVPAGFVFDVHSLPLLLRYRQPKNPAWWGPPALHDWALESGTLSLKEANGLYLRAMRAIGVTPHHRFFAYAGVEIGRRLFPERITRIDPDNVELIRETTGREPQQTEATGALRKQAFRSISLIGRTWLASKGGLL